MATAKKNVEFTSIDQVPAMMTVRQWCELNGVNENKGYEWASRNDTPTIKLGQRIIIPKKAYIKWIEQEIELEKFKNQYEYKELSDKEQKIAEKYFYKGLEKGNQQEEIDNERKQKVARISGEVK